MMKKFFGVITVVLLLCICSCSKTPQVNNSGWYTNYEQCLKNAKAQNKKMFVLFTRNDRDYEIDALKNNVFLAEEFNMKLQKDYLFCNIDFSEEIFAKTRVDPSLKG